MVADSQPKSDSQKLFYEHSEDFSDREKSQKEKEYLREVIADPLAYLDGTKNLTKSSFERLVRFVAEHEVVK